VQSDFDLANDEAVFAMLFCLVRDSEDFTEKYHPEGIEHTSA
jgi:hypothetical protein